MKMINNWNNIFKKEGRFFLKPQKDVPAFARLLKKQKAKRILDLGCGTGRHTIFLTRRGFHLYALDEAPHALRLARAWLKEKNLKASLKRASLYKTLPYPNHFFNGIISTQAMHHGRKKAVKALIKEMARVLTPGGIIFITVPRKKTKKEIKNWAGEIPKYKQIEKHVTVPLSGKEKGIPHFHFNKTLIREYFNAFKIIDLHIDGHHYCFLGIKK